MEDQNSAPVPPRVKRRPGPKKGTRPSGRRKGSKNKAVIERERAAHLAAERLAEFDRLKAEGAKAEIAAAKTSGIKLMKEIAFDFARLFAGIAAIAQPYQGWHPMIGPDGKPVLDARGRPVMENDNPHYDEARFKEYGKLAVETALGAASYESPKLSAVMVGTAIINEIEITGGLPDDQDGGLSSEDVIEGKANVAEDAARNAPRLAGPDADAGAGGAADAAPEAGRVVPHEGEAEGGPLRKAVG